MHQTNLTSNSSVSHHLTKKNKTESSLPQQTNTSSPQQLQQVESLATKPVFLHMDKTSAIEHTDVAQSNSTQLADALKKSNSTFSLASVTQSPVVPVNYTSFERESRDDIEEEVTEKLTAQFRQQMIAREKEVQQRDN
jgi:hypothetical protein